MFESLSGPPGPVDDGAPFRFDGRIMRDRPASQEATAQTTDQLTVWMLAVGRDRDRSAFAALFNHFAPRLKAFMRRGGASEELAEDIVQEAMVQVWRKAHIFDPGRAAVSTWVFRIARNKRIDRLRAEGRPAIDEDSYRADRPDDPGPLDEVASDQAARHMRGLVSTLPREQMQVIEKAFFEDKPHSEIAAELDLPLGTVKSRIRRALARLKGSLPDGEL